MENMVFIFPGQGSQYVGMGEDLYHEYALVRDLFDEASEAVQMDLKELCFYGPEATLVKTEYVQPAITLVNIACLRVLEHEGFFPSASAGHSLGEYSALCAANSIGFIDTMKLVFHRGIFMKEAAEHKSGGMMAIIGLTVDEVDEICMEVSTSGVVSIANHNSPKQFILTGELECLEKASALARTAGAKLTVPLKVSGPWHSVFMADAGERMKGKLATCAMKEPSIPVIANTTADYEVSVDEIRANLVRQVSQSVLWSFSIERFVRDGYTSFLEVGPKKVLRGLMRNISKEVTVLNVEDMKSLGKFLQ